MLLLLQHCSGQEEDYGKAKLCGNNVPDGTSFESKYQTLTLKVSNGSKRKYGFKAKITAN